MLDRFRTYFGSYWSLWNWQGR